MSNWSEISMSKLFIIWWEKFIDVHIKMERPSKYMCKKETYIFPTFIIVFTKAHLTKNL